MSVCEGLLGRVLRIFGMGDIPKEETEREKEGDSGKSHKNDSRIACWKASGVQAVQVDKERS